MTLEELVVKITGDTSGFDKSLKKIAGTAGKAIGATSLAAATGIAALTKSAIDSYADYEQLIGGVETLFKDSANVVEEYANNAYKTAGLSANEYMESVTSFSASLLQSVGGDTAKAAEAANVAITDMADNANKMGTSMESIQHAYQGFAKQNYTMLDNLKLGYGGTKEEMQRLLKDAQKLSGVKYDMNSLKDVYDAIHVVQTELGITGTTAKEAASTISGSAATMKGAWVNMVSGMANENADFDALVGNFVDSLMTFLDNIMPRIEVALGGIVEVFAALFPMLAERLPELTESLLPDIINAITELISALLETLPEMLPVIIEGLTALAFELIDAIIEVLPEVIESLMVCASMLMEAIAEHLPEITTALVDGLILITQAIIDNLPMFLDSFMKLLLAFNDALIQALPQIIDKLPDLIDQIITFLLDALPQFIDAGVKLFVALIEAMPQIIQTITEKVPDIIDSIIDTLIDNIDLIIDCGVELFVALIENLPTIIEEILKAVPDIIEALVDAIIEHIPDIIDAGTDLIKGLFTGIKDAGEWLYKKLKGWCSNVLDWIKGFFGIASPSKEMMEDGKFMVMGLANGITANMGLATGALDTMAHQMENAFDPSLNIAGVNSALNSAFGVRTNLAIEDDSTLQATLRNSNDDIVSILIQTNRQLIEAIEDKELNVSIGDEDIAQSVVRGNKAYQKRTGKMLFAY